MVLTISLVNFSLSQWKLTVRGSRRPTCLAASWQAAQGRSASDPQVRSPRGYPAWPKSRSSLWLYRTSHGTAQLHKTNPASGKYQDECTSEGGGQAGQRACEQGAATSSSDPQSQEHWRPSEPHGPCCHMPSRSPWRTSCSPPSGHQSPAQSASTPRSYTAPSQSQQLQPSTFDCLFFVSGSTKQFIKILSELHDYSQGTSQSQSMDQVQQYEYNPYQWPPDMILAHLHARCSMPGKENPDGEECPCCLRREKLRTTTWFSRNLYKDFKYYGGGVSGYFGLLAYYCFSAIIIIMITGIYHSICLHYACTQRAIQTYECVKLFHFIKIMSPGSIRKNLPSQTMGEALDLMYFITFVFLMMANFATTNHLGRIESKLTKSYRIYSHFSLIFKNIPRFMTPGQFREELVKLYPEVKIKEIVFLQKTSGYYEVYNKLIQLYFKLQYYRMNEKVDQLGNLESEFMKSMDILHQQKQKFQKSTGKAIVVFEQQNQKEFFEKQFQLSKINLLTYHLGRMFKVRSVKEMGMYSNKIGQPGEIIWKYIGDSSIAKTRVRIETGVISVIFLMICAAIIYYPMEKANKSKEQKQVITYNVISAFGLFFFNMLYRVIVAILSNQRRPNSYLSESLFTVVTTVFFHLLFYLYMPVIYYAISKTDAEASIKLRTMFFQVIIFVFASVLIAIIDFKYCIFKGKLGKYLRNTSIAYTYCQKQFHQKLNYPSFPIEFKLMVMYKIWSFTVFYAFQIPEILFLFVPLMVFLYFGDKFRMYTRYKMSTYLSIQLQKDFERSYIYIYIITLCLGYLITATQSWRFYIAPVLAVSMILLRFMMDRRLKKREEDEDTIEKTQTLTNALKTFSQTLNLKQQLFDSDSHRMSTQSHKGDDSVTLKTIDAFTSGYKEMYDSFKHELNVKRINELLDEEEKTLRRKYAPRTDSEMVRFD